MPKIEQQFEEGDTVEVIVKGKISAPALSGTPQGTSLRINRPGKVLFSSLERVGGITVDVVLDGAATVVVNHKSQHPNGVHIDGDGNYWMRKDGGWHAMSVAHQPKAGSLGLPPFTPKAVQRLVEPKDK
jgi:hypothetical protein